MTQRELGEKWERNVRRTREKRERNSRGTGEERERNGRGTGVDWERNLVFCLVNFITKNIEVLQNKKGNNCLSFSDER